MIKKFTVYSLQFTVLISFFLFLLLSPVAYRLSPVLAQTQNCGGGTPARAQGLVTSPSLTGGSKFGSTGACIANDPKVAFAPFKIPTYADLKSIYFDQSNLPKDFIKGNILPGDFKNDGIHIIKGDLNIQKSPNGSGTQVIFVDGNDPDQKGQLTINKNIIFHSSDGGGGLVFVVRDDVLIDKDVTQIDAVIISSGKIYTAIEKDQSSCQTSNTQANTLVINGSLISLNADNPAIFCRKLADNNNPAEIINAQPKYLVILRDLMSDTYQKWSEIP